MKTISDINGYHWDSAEHSSSHDYLLPQVIKQLDRIRIENNVSRFFELGCGNGSMANVLSKNDWDIAGVDPSTEGIIQANTKYPNLRLEHGSAYEDLAARFGKFPIVVSLEVVEHVYDPRHYAATVYSLLEVGGTAIISTPYHGYWKNLALAVTGKMDSHFDPLWDHGHIKFWSIKTLTELLREAGFDDIKFIRVGRIPPLAKSMFAIAKRP